MCWRSWPTARSERSNSSSALALRIPSEVPRTIVCELVRQVVVLAKNARTNRLLPILPPHDFEYLDLDSQSHSIIRRLENKTRNLIRSKDVDPWRMSAKWLLQLFGSRDIGLISLDNSIALVRALCEEGFDGPIILVQHGTNHFSYDQPVSTVLPNSILLSWGEREVATYSLYGCRTQYVVPVGSIESYNYSESNTLFVPITKRNQICIVSEYRDDQSEQGDDYMKMRVASWTILLSQLRSCMSALDLTAHIALRPTIFGATESAQREYFAEALGQGCRFTSHDEPYSSYKLIDNSEMVFGLQSAMLTESIGRNKKVIFVNPLNDDRMVPPLGGLCGANGLSTDELIKHVKTVLSLSIAEYQESLHPSIDYLIRPNFDTGHALVLASTLLRRGCSAAEIAAGLSHL